MLEHAAILGPATGKIYCQTLTFDNLALVLCLESATLGRELLTKIEESINLTPEITPEQLVKNYVSSLNQEDLGIGIAKITNGQLDLALVGKIQAKIYRQGQIINLASASGSLSGPIFSADLLILATEAFFEIIPPTSIDASLSPEEIKDQLAPNLEADKNGVAAVFVKIPPTEAVVAAPLFTKPKRRTLYALVILGLFIASVLTYQLRSKTLDQKFAQVQAITQQTQQDVDAANKLAGLNDTLARQTLTRARENLLSQAATDFGADWQTKNDPATAKVKTILDNLDKLLVQVSHIHNVSLNVFSDLTLLRANALVSSASLVKDQIMVADSNNGSLYSVTADSKTASIIGGSDNFKTKSYVDFQGKNIYVANKNGIFSLESQIATPSAKWNQITGLKFFAGNLYLLDPQANQIWKYQGTDLGFTGLTPYLKEGLSVDLSHVVDFAIDGYVYVLSSSGEIVRFSGGTTTDFNITGLDTPLKNPTSIFATDETKNIYILDAGNNRVVVLNKEGNYQAQYQYRTPIAIGAGLILADETVKKIFLIGGSKIYSIDL